jgi:transcriptional regulator of arginine metabolism
MKNDRQNKILELIKNENIETQEELTKRLKECGINVTQATVSRDIKELRLTKTLTTDGVYIYSIGKEVNPNYVNKLKHIFRESVISIDSAANLIVIKTLSGMASAAASAIDALNLDDVIGSIAGDDTIMVVARSEKSATQFIEQISDILSND